MTATTQSRPRRSLRQALAEGDAEVRASLSRIAASVRADLERLAQLEPGHPDLIDHDGHGGVEAEHSPAEIKDAIEHLERSHARPAADRREPAWPAIDGEQIRRFLELLGKPKGTARIRAFLPKDHPAKGADPGRKGPASRDRIERWQAEGRGVYAVIGNGGDTDAEITSVPAVFAEWDDRPKDWQVGCWRELGLPEPTMQVDSGGRSVHSFWVLQEALEPGAWRQLQTRLLEHADADRSLKNPSRVMRLPGCWYMTADGPQAMARIISSAGHRYSPEQIAACLPEPPAPAAPAPAPARRDHDARPLEQVRDALQRIPAILPDTGQRERFRSLAWGLLCAVREAGGDDALAQQLLAAHSPLVRDAADYLRTDPHSVTAASFWGMAREAGWRPQGHRQQQTAAVPAATPQQATPKPTGGDPFRVLGWCPDRSRVYYQHRETGQIASIKPAAQAGPLLQLAPIGWWASFHPGGRGGSGVDWAGALSDVIEQADAAGVFAIDRVRGRGLWTEGSRVVWHLGDRLEVDGQPVELIEHRSAHHYPRLPALDIDPAVPPLTDTEGREILAAVAAMGWASPLDPMHLLGWTVLAGVGGALDKRPVLQITSRFASGKTTTKDRVLLPLLAGLAISRSNSTEAGIRQLLRADTLPVVIDESEGEDHGRREGHLKLARLSFDGTPTDRGTTHGQALSYAIRSAVALIGINCEIRNPAERSRTVVVGRVELPQAQWAEVDRRLQQLLTVETGARLLRRAVTNLPTLRHNVLVFRRAVEAQLGGGAAARAGDCYGALLAGAHLLVSTAEVDDGQALGWLDSIGWSAAAALGESGGEGQDATAESRQCLAHLLGHEEPWRSDSGTGRLTIRELLELARSPSGADDAEQARKALGRRGIRATDSGLEVANSAEALAPIYGKTKWQGGGHRARLLDLPGAYAAGAARFPVLGIVRATKLPWELLS